MRRSTVATYLVLVGCAGLGTGARPALAASLCVGTDPGCLSTLRGAIAAARDGDVIRLAPGTFPGDVTIDRSVKLIGAGPDRTTIRGGGPVLTIGVPGAPSEPTVSIRGVTITGGVTSSSSQCGPVCGTDYVQATALGGGIEVPPAAGSTTGATVTVNNSVIAGNRVAPSVTVPSVRSICFGAPCRFALAGGGGIDNWGTISLTNTSVSDNRVGGPVNSDAEGGGILNEAPGSLTLKDSRVENNQATASAPNGRFAEAGGIFADGGTLTITGGAVARNTAVLSAALPSDVAQAAIGGGIDLSDRASASIVGARIDGNRLSATNALGDATAFSAGIHADGPLVLRDSSVSYNRLTSATPTGSAHADSGAGELNASPTTVTDTRFIANTVIVGAPDGTADAAAGALVTAGFEPIALSDSVVSGNRVSATTTSGTANGEGAGMANIGLLTLRNTIVTDNAATVTGPGGVAQGGGIWNGPAPDGPPVELTLIDSALVHNILTASAGISVQGGGLFTTAPVTLKDTTIAENSPDQCQGC
jgi:hypothetical protein